MTTAKPAPFPRGEEQGWFDAAREGRLLYQQCADCGAVHAYPRAVCPSCWSSAPVDKASFGRGVVYSFTTQYRPGGPGFAGDVPYTLVLVDLEEGSGCSQTCATVGQTPRPSGCRWRSSSTRRGPAGLSYLHPGMLGLYLLLDAVEQLRGAAGERQVPGASVSLVHGMRMTLAAHATAVLSTEP